MLTNEFVDGLIRETPQTFRVNSRAYTDPSVFDLEQERVFLKTWNFIAHESELPDPGDFKTAYLGTQAVICTRDQDRTIHVVVNRCAHRGSIVCRERSGNARGFVCPYHSWSYDMAGRLTGIPSRDEPNGYGSGFEQPEGLRRIPRVESYRGFIFACADPNVLPLADYLAGGITQLIDRKLKQSPLERITLQGRPFIGTYKGNWKFQAENIVDGYHFMFTHRAFVRLQQKYGNSTGDFGVHLGDNAAQMRALRLSGNVLGSPHGHGANQKPASDIEQRLDGPFAAYFGQLRERHGMDELRWIFGAGAACVFPNFGLIHNQLRIWRPIAADLTEVSVHPYSLDGAPDEYNEGLLRSHERFYGPAGYGAADDLEVFNLTQDGLSGKLHDWLIMERGMHSERRLERGEIEGLPSSETVHRAFWRKWRDLVAPRAQEEA